MRVVSWNIQHLEQYDRTDSLEIALKKTLDQQQPDVLLLQEVDVNKSRTGHVDQTQVFSKALNAVASRFKSTKLKPVGDGQYGLAIVSQLPVKSWHELDLFPSPIGRRLTFKFGDTEETFYVHDHPRAALAAILENGWCVVNTHLSFVPVSSHLQMLRVVLWAKKLAKQHNAKLLVGGDLNFSRVKWLEKFGLFDSVKGLSFPAWEPETQIDHLLIQDPYAVRNSKIGEQSAISDHLWIAVEL